MYKEKVKNDNEINQKRKVSGMKNCRKEKVLQILLMNSPQPTTSRLLSSYLGVSTRTVKQDIKELNEKLKKCHVSIQSQRGVGYFISKVHRDKIKDFLDKGELVDEGFSDLKYKIIEYLLFRSTYISVEALSELFFYSSSTILKVIEQSNKELNKHGLSIIKEPRKGIKLKGSEKNQRIYHAHLLKNKYFSQNSYQNMLDLQAYLPEKIVERVQSVLTEFQRKDDVILTDMALKALIIHIVITIKRIHEGSEMPLSELEIFNLKQNKEWQYAQSLARLVSLEFEMEISESEIGYLCIHLLAANLRQNEAEIFQKNLEENDLYQKLEQWILELDQEFNTCLSKDSQFLMNVYFHLQPLLKRLAYGINIFNPWTKKMKLTEKESFEIAVQLAQKIINHEKYTISDDEIAYLAMHIGASLERKKLINKKIAIICVSGIGTSNFIKAKLKRLYPTLNICAVYSSLDLEKEDFDEDILLTTVPLVVPNKTVVQITPLLTLKDQEKIEKVIKYQQAENEKVILTKYFYPDLFEVNVSLKTREEVLKYVGNILYKNHYVDKKFLKGLLGRERISSTAMGNLLALPHSFEGSVFKQAICLIILKQPILWDKEEYVQIVMALALDERAKQDFELVFREVVWLVEGIDNQKKLLKAKHFKDLMKIIKN